jgi:hypothetical protein
MRRYLLPVVALGLLAMAAPAVAQQLRLNTPSREPTLMPPARDAVRHPREADVYPGGPDVFYDPAFIRQLSWPVEYSESTGRAGVSVWIAPSTPVGGTTGQREINGWPSIGWSITWDGPPPLKRARTVHVR